MNFETQPPAPLAFDLGVEKILPSITDLTSIERKDPFSFPPEYFTNHYGVVDLGGESRAVSLDEKDGVVTTVAIDDITSKDLLSDISLKLKTKAICTALDERSIAWNMPNESSIELYESWLAIYIERGKPAQIVWLNPEVFSDLDLIERAFPSNK